MQKMCFETKLELQLIALILDALRDDSMMTRDAAAAGSSDKLCYRLYNFNHGTKLNRRGLHQTPCVADTLTCQTKWNKLKAERLRTAQTLNIR